MKRQEQLLKNSTTIHMVCGILHQELVAILHSKLLSAWLSHRLGAIDINKTGAFQYVHRVKNDKHYKWNVKTSFHIYSLRHILNPKSINQYQRNGTICNFIQMDILLICTSLKRMSGFNFLKHYFFQWTSANKQIIWISTSLTIPAMMLLPMVSCIAWKITIQKSLVVFYHGHCSMV